MPFVMKHAPSGTLLSYAQRNGYSLAYYGLRLWEEAPTVVEMAEALAEAGIAPDDPGGELAEWEPLMLSEHEAKMANVKLRNDPKRVVAYREGAIVAQ